MTLPGDEAEKIRQLIKDKASNFPDIDNLVADGKLVRKSGWYQVNDPEAFEALKHYVAELRRTKDGRLQVKIKKPTKQFMALASRL